MKTIYLDGKYFKVTDRLLDVFTPGIFQARGVFETMLGLDGVVLDAEDHLKRLRAGLKVLKFKAPLIDSSLLKRVLHRNKFACARIRLMAWQSGGQMRVMAAAVPYKISDKKMRVCLIKTDRPANSRFANVKSLDYGLFAQAYAQAQAKGCDEALLLNSRGHIFEASRANIFWTKDKTLYTPPLSSGCLNGITRQQVIRQAKNLKVPFKEQNLTVPILKKADQVFLTNSLAGIKAVERIIT